MKPIPPAPTLNELFQRVPHARLREVLNVPDLRSRAGSRYLHWDQLRHRAPPSGLTPEEWWFAIKVSRAAVLREIPLHDAGGRPFRIAMSDEVQEMLHQVDQRATGRIAFPDALTNPETRDRYVVSSLIEESITSSQMEGASTTRKVAADMLRTGRPPADRSERMILNNYEAIEFVRSIRDRPITPGDVLELHALVTAATLHEPAAAGRLQTSGEQRVTVVDRGTQEILHHPPPADQLLRRLVEMCQFANGETPANRFVHPVVRAIVLHFWLAYDHPFEDGNGRTARALFYWAMLRNGYWLFEYVSISAILRKAFAQHRRSYLYSESDENDATYFLVFQLEVLLRGIDRLDDYLKTKIAQTREVEGKLRNAARFNHRQLALLGHALRHPGAEYTIKSHQRSHVVAYATARADLMDLARARLLLQRRRDAKTLVFVVPDNLERKLEGRGR